MTENTLAPQPGDFACVPIHGAGGLLISFGEFLAGAGFSHYDHAFVYVGYLNSPREPGTPGGDLKRHGYIGPGFYVVEAEPGGARLRQLAPRGTLVPVIPEALWSSGAIQLSTVQRQVIVSNCIGLLGTPYSWLDYAALALHHLHINAPGVRRRIRDSHHLICSQLVDYVYQQAGVMLFTDKRWNGYVMPTDLAELIEP